MEAKSRAFLFVSVILKYSPAVKNLGSGYSLVGLLELNELLLAKACYTHAQLSVSVSYHNYIIQSFLDVLTPGMF